jgi:hypothetical protein
MKGYTFFDMEQIDRASLTGTTRRTSRRGSNVGPLRLAAAKGDILAHGLINHDCQIVGRNAHRRDDTLINYPEKCQPGIFVAPGNKGNLDQDQVVRIGQAQEARRVNVAVRR